MINRQDLEKILIENKILDQAQIKELIKKTGVKDNALEKVLFEKKIVSSDLLYKLAAGFYKMPFIELKNRAIRKDILFLIPEVTARAHNTVAFDKNDRELLVATLDINNIELFEFLAKRTQLEIKTHISTPEGINEALKHYRRGLSAEFKEISEENGTDGVQENGHQPDDLKNLAQDLPIIRIVDTLLEYAILEKASDIHIEPAEKEIVVRYRVDGVLKKVMTLPKSVHAGVAARIKVLANLKLDEHRLPQDGRFKITSNENRVAFRVSVVPTFDGEKIVMRLLPENNQQLTLDDLGFQSEPLEMVKRNIDKPHGMILVTGPTGSGKTTTLYTILNILNKPEVNISTIEDPIEYRMPGINQSQVQPKIGFTFAAGLRSFLRQDPDIIMVGEIRDKETADIAINAAMTGHLVLSTLHTNDAVTTIPRLLDMEIPSFLLASTINLIIAQRLVRKICKNCIESYQLSKKEALELAKEFDLAKLQTGLTQKGFLAKNQKIETLLFYRGKGCQQCGNSGYKGRIGIYEVLEVTESIATHILKETTRDDLEKIAHESGMITILQDGFAKAKNGITTIEEILRVTRE